MISGTNKKVHMFSCFDFSTWKNVLISVSASARTALHVRMETSASFHHFFYFVKTITWHQSSSLFSPHDEYLLSCHCKQNHWVHTLLFSENASSFLLFCEVLLIVLLRYASSFICWTWTPCLTQWPPPTLSFWTFMVWNRVNKMYLTL